MAEVHNRAYLAGLIDGEGSIYVSVTETDSVTGYRIRPRFRIGMKSDRSIQYVKPVLESFCEEHGIQYNLNERANQYSWRFEVAGGEKVREFLEPLIPFMKVKQERANIVVNTKWQFPRGTGHRTEQEKKEKMIQLMKKREKIRELSANRDSQYDVETVREGMNL